MCAVLLFGLCPAAPGAELPAALKPTADEFDASMKTCDGNLEVLIKVSRDAYLSALELTQKQSEAAKRPAEVEAIGKEIAALKAGPLPAEATPGLPPTVGVYRERFLAGVARAKARTESQKRSARERYTQWLEKMGAAVKGRDKSLEAAIESEKKRAAPLDPVAPK